MDFELPKELVDLRDRVAAFVRDEVIPAENGAADIKSLRDKARKAGIYGPQLPREYASSRELCHSIWPPLMAFGSRLWALGPPKDQSKAA